MSDDQERSLRQAAKVNRERVAGTHREVIIQEEAKKAVDVRQNMTRLRELRLAKEAQEVGADHAEANQPAKAKPKKRSG